MARGGYDRQIRVSKYQSKKDGEVKGRERKSANPQIRKRSVKDDDNEGNLWRGELWEGMEEGRSRVLGRQKYPKWRSSS